MFYQDLFCLLSLRKDSKTQQSETMSGIRLVCQCGYLCHGLYIVQLGELHMSQIFCTGGVLLFTAIEGMHNGLGRALDIHHGETVGFP